VLKRILALIGIVIIAIVLALTPKSTEVEIEAKVEGVSFYVEKKSGIMEPIKLITSPSAESIKLNGIKEIYISIEDLFTCEGTPLMQDSNRLIIKPESSEFSSITFEKEEGDLDLKFLQVMPDSFIEVFKGRDNSSIDVAIKYEGEMEEDIGGELSVGKPFKLLLERCEGSDEQGDFLLNPIGTLRCLQVRPIPQSILFQAASTNSMNVGLSFSGEDYLVPPISRKNILVKKIKFLTINQDGTEETTVIDGQIKFVGSNKEPIELDEFDFVVFPSAKGFVLRKFEIYPKEINLTLVGSTHRLGIGNTIDSTRNIIPSWLEWLGTNQLVGLIIGFITGAITFILFFWEKMVGQKGEGA
jgi:hypothetical protein